MSARVDLFYNSYANFADDVLATVRAQTYGRDIGQNSWVTVDEYDAYIEALGLGPSSQVLEVASGSGGPALYLAERSGCSVTGIDLNPSGVLTATALAARAGRSAQVAFRVADAQTPLRFDAGTFDALLCIDSMNHFPDRLDSLKEWCRVLKPGGRAAFTDPVVVTGPVTNDELAQRSSIGLFVFLPKGLNEELIVKAGFRIVSQTDATENAALISRRWREARRHFRDDLQRIEGKERFEGVQKFLGAVHKLTSERRLSRISWVVEKPVN
jgi:SAM-dependent methyltransferase